MKTTIAAISTPVGIGGIAVIRLSGEQSLPIVLGHLHHKKLQPNYATYGLFHIDNEILDEVVVTYYAAPRSYTGEDMVEISCHGSAYIQQTLLKVLLDDGCTMAAPGEFTQRAFLNGRLDLSQAEAVADLIESTNHANQQLAISQMRGGYSEKLKSLRQQFIDLTTLLELELDFSDEEVEFADRGKLEQLVDHLTDECSRLANSFSTGNAIKQGIPVAIVGRPNAGKSTLLNTLLGDDRAIVSETPGTTRDTIEDTLTIDGIGFRIIDTAGLRQSDNDIESAGIERSRKAAAKASTVLYMVDARQSIDETVDELMKFIGETPLENKTLVVAINKIDLVDTPPILPDNVADHLPTGTQYHTVHISTKKHTHIDLLLKALTCGLTLDDDPTPLVSNLRHYEALTHIVTACGHIKEGFDQNLPADLLVIDIRDALYHLGTITGEVASDEILGNIFSRFCIGK